MCKDRPQSGGGLFAFWIFWVPVKAAPTAAFRRQIEIQRQFSHIMHQAAKGGICVENKAGSNGAVKNVFKYGRKPTKEAYTKVWIDLIHHTEHLKAIQQSVGCGFGERCSNSGTVIQTEEEKR